PSVSATGGPNPTALPAATTPEPTPSQDPSLLLVQPRHAECDGTALFRYLASGDSGGDPRFAENWASARAEILAAPADARDDLARQKVDAQIQTCDQRLTQQEQQAAAASAQQEQQ